MKTMIEDVYISLPL